MTRRVRLARTIALLGLLLACGGCALLAEREPVNRVPPSQGQGEAEPQPPPPSPEGLVIDAPPELRTLLLRNLDLARLTALAEAETPDEVEWLRLVAAAPAQVRELLQTEGYFHPEVQVQRERGPPPVVHVRVRPGPRVHVQEVMLSVQGVVRERADTGDAAAREQIQQLHAWWPLPPGDTFRNPDWAAAKTGALARLRAAGYASASITASAAQVDADANQVQLTLTLDSGPLFLAGELRIEGLVLHDEAAVRNLAGFGRGEAADRSAAAGLPGAPAQSQPVRRHRGHLRQRPGRCRRFTGHRATARTAAAVAHPRRWRQRQQRSARDARAHPPPRVRSAHHDAQQDRIRARPSGLRRRAQFAPRRAFLSQPDRRRRSSGSKAASTTCCQQRLRVGRTQDTNRVERLYFLGLDRSVQTVGTLNKEAAAFSVNYHGIWRDLDSVILPTRGISISGQGGVGLGHQQLRRQRHLRPRLWADHRLPAVGHSRGTASARLELGQIFKSDTVAVPDALAFRAGGDESVRGYDYRTLAPDRRRRRRSSAATCWPPPASNWHARSNACRVCGGRCSSMPARGQQLERVQARARLRRRRALAQPGRPAAGGRGLWTKSYTKCVCTCRWALRSKLHHTHRT